MTVVLANDKVPDPVIGPPDNPVPEPTEVTVPPESGGSAQDPSALRKLAVPPPLAGARPFRDVVNVSNIAVTSVPVRSSGAAEPPVLFPLMVIVEVSTNGKDRR